MLRKRTTVDPRVRDYIEQEARFDREATYRALAAAVRNRMRKEGITPLLALPKARAIQAIAQFARKNPGPSPDDPWSLGTSPSDIPPDATGDLLAVLKESLKAEHRFTIREARWVARLRSALSAERPTVLLKWAAIYAGRETYWARERKDAPLYTSDMDAELAFHHWKSSWHEWEYDTAVLTGSVPNQLPRITYPGYVGSRIRKVYDEFAGGLQPVPLLEAERLLREVGPVGIDRLPWWEHAEAVVVFWLREIRTKVKKWELVGYVGDEELGPGVCEEWERLTRLLAKAVVQRAEELERWHHRVEATREQEEYRYKEGNRLNREARQAYKDNKRRALRSINEQLEALRTHRAEVFAGLDSELLSSQWQPTDILREFGYEE